MPNYTFLRIGFGCPANSATMDRVGLLEAMGVSRCLGRRGEFLITRSLAAISNTVSEIGFQAHQVGLKLQQIAQIVKILEWSVQR